MSPHRVDEYLEGLLAEDAADAFLDHLAVCAACQRALHADVQLRDREDALRAEVAARPTPVVAIATARRRRGALVIGGALVLAAAAAAFVVTRPARRAQPSTPALALAPSRGLEARLAWAPAAGYRPYDPVRSERAVGEAIDPRVIAALAERGDCAGVAATYVLSGELVRAGQQYDRCGDGADLDADRAGRAVMAGEPERALALADRALAIAPAHPVAHWNRALALRDLGLGLAAAAAFERVAVIDPPWAEEARQRAEAARAPLERQRDGYDEAIAAAAAMAAGGPPVTLELARRYPARVALRLDDAIRLAATPARLAELRPLALELDAVADVGLVARLDAARPAPVPAALQGPYLGWVEQLTIADDATRRAWLTAAAARRADELMIGAVILGARADGVPARLAAVAAARGGWLAAMYEVVAVRTAAPADAERRLAELTRACAARELSAYPCARVAYQRAELALGRYQAPATVAAAREAVQLAEGTGEWGLRWRALALAATAERIRGAPALAQAYLDEYVRSAATCEAAADAARVAGEYAFDRHDLAGAEAALRDHPACGPTPRLIDLQLEADLATAGRALRPSAALRADLAALAPRDEFEARMAAFLRARAGLDDDPAAAAALRALVIAGDAADGGPGRPSVTWLAASALTVTAARAGRWDDGVAALALAAGTPPPTRCALAVASDNFRFAAIAIGADGRASGVALDDRVGRDQLPVPVVDALTGCAEVAVWATAPWFGRDLGLPPGLPWWFVLGPARAPVAGATRRVVVVDPVPPAWLALPRIGVGVAPAPSATTTILRGPDATVAAVARAAATATVLEIHAHTARVPASDAPALALSDDRDDWAATAERVRAWRLAGAPVVLLADCNAVATAAYEQIDWGLPRAFAAAGARAIVAADGLIPDREAGEVFAALGDAAARGVAMPAAVAELRAAKIAADPASWVRRLVVFQ
ncbi:MAG: CHAT domain-containing protein [Myxococcales bacterium]|nr:CHAT domain-containing protein [Myxococcales bacterium]